LLGRGLAEGALQFVQRHFARTQRPLQCLLDQLALYRRGRRLNRCRRRFGWYRQRPDFGQCGFAGGHRRYAALHHRFELADQVLVVAFRLGLGRLELAQDLLDAIDRGQDQRDRLTGHRHAVAELAHQRFGGMRECFQPRQAEKAAGPLDGVNKAEDVIQNLGVVRFLLEPHQLIVDRIQALAGLRQELPQQIIHQNKPSKNLGLQSTVNRSSRRTVCAPGLARPGGWALQSAGAWGYAVLAARETSTDFHH
jgi:hypothetical protein